MELSKTDLKWLEERFTNYSNYHKEIQMRRFELNYKPENETPEIQKQPSQVSQVETFVIKVYTDDYINDRYRWIEGVSKVYNDANKDLKEVIEVKFRDCPYYSWEDTANHLHYSTSKIYRMRYEILKMLAKEISYI